MLDDLARLITAEIRPGRGRLVSIHDITSGEVDAENSDHESPYARLRVSPPDFVYDTHTIVEEKASQPREDPTILMQHLMTLWRRTINMLSSVQELATAYKLAHLQRHMTVNKSIHRRKCHQ